MDNSFLDEIQNLKYAKNDDLKFNNVIGKFNYIFYLMLRILYIKYIYIESPCGLGVTGYHYYILH